MNYTRLLRESNKQWEVLSKNNGLVPLWSGMGRDGPNRFRGKVRKVQACPTAKDDHSPLSRSCFSGFWLLTFIHSPRFSRFWSLFHFYEVVWNQMDESIPPDDTLVKRIAEFSMQTFNFEDKNGFRSYERQNINGHGRNANYQNHAWSYPNFATVVEQNLKLETVGLSDCIASYQESEAISIVSTAESLLPDFLKALGIKRVAGQFTMQ